RPVAAQPADPANVPAPGARPRPGRRGRIPGARTVPLPGLPGARSGGRVAATPDTAHGALADLPGPGVLRPVRTSHAHLLFPRLPPVSPARSARRLVARRRDRDRGARLLDGVFAGRLDLLPRHRPPDPRPDALARRPTVPARETSRDRCGHTDGVTGRGGL